MPSGAASAALSAEEIAEVKRIVQRAWKEDVGAGDATTAALVPKGVKARAAIVLREPGIVCGLPVAQLVFRRASPRLIFRYEKGDGDEARAGEEVATIFGAAAPILTAERLALNFAGRLSGIATLTREFVRRAGAAAVYDTRKTTPGLRVLEKYAVRAGGGRNHRMSLAGTMFVKDNHKALAGDFAALLTPGAIVEAESPEEAERLAALPAVAKILLDNFDVAALRDAVARIRRVNPKVEIEASGGVRIENVAEIAATGVDAVSVGALTHSARSLDVTLDVRRV